MNRKLAQLNGIVFPGVCILVLCCYLLLTACSADDNKTQPNRPNILFVIVDDLRPLLGAYGVPDAVTPNIDRLAADGVTFRRAYSQWPVCGPSRASFMSGLRPSTSGIHYSGQNVQSKIPDAITLPRHFRNHGYQTYSIGKVYHGRDEDPGAWSEAPWQAPEATDNWQGYVSDATRDLRTRLWRAALADNPDAELYQFNGPPTEASDQPDAAYVDGATALQAITTMRNTSRQPFFLAVGFVKPHLPFAVPQKYWDLYDRSALPAAAYGSRPAGGTDIPYLFGELRAYHGIPDDLDLPLEQARDLVHGYFASISFIDAQVGLLLDALDQLNLRDNTIVVLIGDHGFHLGEQGLWGKHSLYELSLRSPLIVSAPRQNGRNLSSDALVEFIDIYPSLAELAGLPRPTAVDGRSFVPLMKDPDAPGKELALSQYRHFMEPYRDTIGYSIRTDRYRYTEWRRNDSVFARELYDLTGWTLERANVADDPQHADAVRQLSEHIDGFLVAR